MSARSNLGVERGDRGDRGDGDYGVEGGDRWVMG